MNPKVSIIIPIYNMEKYLGECLDSIVRQTLKEIEILCIDDGSTDNSLCILTKYKENYENIVVITQTNQGAGAARNAGIDIARGEYIAFMDPDDFYPADDVLEILYKKAIDNHVDICGGSICTLVEGKIHYDVSMARSGSKFLEEGMIEYCNYQYAFGYTRFLYKMELIQEKEISFPNYRRFQDPPFMVEAMLAANKFYAIPKVVYCARVVDKKIEYANEELIIDITNGMKKILGIALENNLSILFKSIIDELHGRYEMRIFNQVLKGSERLQDDISVINAYVDSFIGGDNTYSNNMKLMLYDKGCCMARNKERILVEFDTQLGKFKNIIIYGAGNIGKETFDYIIRKFASKDIYFAVTKLECSETTAREQKIYEIDELVFLRGQAIVLMAVSKMHEKEVMKNILDKGFDNVITVDYEAIQLLG